MICPYCSENIRYRERNNNVCSKCHKEFAFEPKTHPLLLSDLYFSNAVKRLSSYDKFFFTSEQLQFALSRKKMKNRLSPYLLIIPMLITTIIASVFYVSLGVLVFLGWSVFIILKIRSVKSISIPDAGDFNYGVLGQWKSIYGKYPDKLILNNSVPNNPDFNAEGVLLCEDNQTAVCLLANQVAPSLTIITNENLLNNLLDKNKGLPIFVLHNASSNGYHFYEKVKQQFGTQTRVIDIGLRPQSVMNSKLMKFREKGEINNFNSLTTEENRWLNDGFYTPLFILKPEKLIQYITRQIARNKQFIPTENVEQKAKAIGFMTWAGD